MRLTFAGLLQDMSAENGPKITVLSVTDLTGAPGLKVFVLEAQYPPRAATPEHRHAGDTLIRIEAGQLNVMFSDQPPVEYDQGSVIRISAGVAHSISNSSDAPARAFEILALPKTALIAEPGGPIS